MIFRKTASLAGGKKLIFGFSGNNAGKLIGKNFYVKKPKERRIGRICDVIGNVKSPHVVVSVSSKETKSEDLMDKEFFTK